MRTPTEGEQQVAVFNPRVQMCEVYYVQVSPVHFTTPTVWDLNQQ